MLVCNLPSNDYLHSFAAGAARVCLSAREVDDCRLTSEVSGRLHLPKRGVSRRVAAMQPIAILFCTLVFLCHLALYRNVKDS